MGHAAGLRAGTRYAFSRDFKKKGMVSFCCAIVRSACADRYRQIALSTYLRQYRVGDIVDVVANGMHSPP